MLSYTADADQYLRMLCSCLSNYDIIVSFITSFNPISEGGGLIQPAPYEISL